MIWDWEWIWRTRWGWGRGHGSTDSGGVGGGPALAACLCLNWLPEDRQLCWLPWSSVESSCGGCIGRVEEWWCQLSFFLPIDFLFILYSQFQIICFSIFSLKKCDTRLLCFIVIWTVSVYLDHSATEIIGWDLNAKIIDCEPVCNCFNKLEQMLQFPLNPWACYIIAIIMVSLLNPNRYRYYPSQVFLQEGCNFYAHTWLYKVIVQLLGFILFYFLF